MIMTIRQSVPYTYAYTTRCGTLTWASKSWRAANLVCRPQQ